MALSRKQTGDLVQTPEWNTVVDFVNTSGGSGIGGPISTRGDLWAEWVWDDVDQRYEARTVSTTPTGLITIYQDTSIDLHWRQLQHSGRTCLGLIITVEANVT